MILIESYTLEENLAYIKIKNSFKYKNLSIDQIKNKLY